MKAFLSKLFTMMFGSALGQVAAAAAAPILSRLFTPEDYGVTGLVSSIAMIMVFVSTMRYEAVIVSGKTDTSRSNAFVLAMIILFCVAALLALGVCFFWMLSEQGVLPEGAVGPIYLFAPLILLLSVTQVRVMPPLLIQHSYFRLVSLGNMLNGALGALSQIGFGLIGTGAIGLLAGRAVGLALALITMLVPLSRRLIIPILRASRKRVMRRVAWSYRGQALLLAPAGLINTVAMQLPVFVIAATYGTAASGAYFFTQSLANALLAVFRKSLTSLMAKQGQELRSSGRPIRPFVIKFTALVAVATFGGALVLFFTAEELLPLVFGDRWDEAGMIAKWLGFFYAVSVTHLPLSALSTLLKFQRAMLYTQIGQLVAIASALAIGVWLGDLESTVALVALAAAGVYAINMLVMFRLIGRDDQARLRAPKPG